MVRLRVVWGSLLLAACGAACLFPDLGGLAGGAGDAGGSDVALEASVDAGATCDPSKPFTSIRPIAELNDGDDQYRATLTANELDVWYGLSQTLPEGGSVNHILHAARTSPTGTFGAGILEPAGEPGKPVDPALSDDDLSLYFVRPSGNAYQLLRATRLAPDAAFGAGVTLPAAIQSSTSNIAPFSAADGSLYFASLRGGNGNYDIYRAALGDGGFEAPVPVPSLSSPTAADTGVVVTRDGLWAYVTSNRTDLGTAGGQDVFLARRATTTDDFGTPVNVTEINSPFGERADWLSRDQCRLYFESTRNDGGGEDLFVAEKSP